MHMLKWFLGADHDEMPNSVLTQPTRLDLSIVIGSKMRISSKNDLLGYY